MKNLRSLFSFAIVMILFTGMTFTSCGGKKDAKDAEQTEHPADAEHPAEADSEHPADADSEHPADTTEHPADNDSSEHPADN